MPESDHLPLKCSLLIYQTDKEHSVESRFMQNKCRPKNDKWQRYLTNKDIFMSIRIF